MSALFGPGLSCRLARLTSAALLLLVVNGASGVASAATPPPPPSSTPATSASTPPVIGEIVVKPKAPATIAAVNTRYQTSTLFQLTDSPAALIQTSDLNGTLAAMANDGAIEWFEANNTARQPAAKDDSGADPYCGTSTAATSGPSSQDDSGADPYCTHVVASGADEYADQWSDYALNLRWAQRKNFQGQGITIAVLDTQVELSHPALANKLLPNLDLVPLDPQTNVPTTGLKRGHGTFVAGVALHVASGAKVLPVHVLNEDGRGSTALVAEGIRQAAKAGAQVINMSLSTPTPSRALQDAVAYAQQKGIVMVAAYGNEGLKQPPVYPANFGNVISVVATDDSDIKAKFTNYGDKADVAAPGVNIVGPWRDGQYGLGSGTSFATPLVAGEAAVLLASGSAKNGGDAVNRIVSGIENIDKVNGGAQGYGRINLATALLK